MLRCKKGHPTPCACPDAAMGMRDGVHLACNVGAHQTGCLVSLHACQNATTVSLQCKQSDVLITLASLITYHDC